MSHHKPAYGQREKPAQQLPVTPASASQQNPQAAKDKASDKDQKMENDMWIVDILKRMSVFERIMAILTLAGVVIAVFTGLIFWKQLDEMRTDQRAWITFSAGLIQYPQDEASIGIVRVSVPITITNIGKTAARVIDAQFVMDYEVEGQSPDFVYDGRARTFDTIGIIFPGTPTQPFNVPFSKEMVKDPRRTEPRYLTSSEYHDLQNGNGYMAIYGQATFIDIFGRKHWVHYCTFFVAPDVAVYVSSKACVDYNDTDHD